MNLSLKSIDDWLLTSADTDCAANALVDDQSVAAMACLMLDWDALLEDSASTPDARRQGLLQCLYELQQGLVDLSGLAQATLSVSSRQEGAHAVFAMLAKLAARDGQGSSKVIKVGAVSPVFALAAGNADIELSVLDDLAGTAIDPQSVGAVVVPLAMLYAGSIDLSEIKAYRAKGGVVIVDGLEQHVLPWPGDQASLVMDIILLDMALAFGVSEASPALVAGERFAALLPLPVIGEANGVFHTQGAQQRPHSIGPLNEDVVGLSSLVHCFVVLRALGVRGVQQRALKTVALNRCLLDSLTASADDAATHDSRAIYALEVGIRQEHLDKASPLTPWLRQLDVPLLTHKGEPQWRVSTRQLAALRTDTLTRVIAELGAVGVDRLD